MTTGGRTARFGAVSFDLYGTLLTTDPALLPVIRIDGQSNPSPLAAAVERLMELRPMIRPGDLVASYLAAVEQTRVILRGRDHRELPAEHSFRLCLDSLGLEGSELPKMLQQAFNTACIDAARPVPGAVELLRRIAAGGRPIGIISNLPDPSGWDRLLELLGSPRFDFVILSGEYGWRKPSPRIFSAAIRSIGLPAASILHVGDEYEADMAGAHRAGMLTAWISQTPHPADPGPDFQLGSLEDLRPLL